MGTVTFFNKGIIAPESITSFGVSVKESTNPIGYFGTGLKYAIAVFLRLGCSITIKSGGNTFTFGTKLIEVRNAPFNYVTMNGEPLSFTTELGKNWEAWQAFRELYCNALDEGGDVILVNEEKSSIDESGTYVMVSGQAALDCYHRRETIVLRKAVPLPSSRIEEVEIYDVPSKYIYYRGIRVLTLNKTAKLTYNILTHQHLTEDRTLKDSGVAMYLIERCITSLRDKDLLLRVLEDNDCMEANFNFSTLDYWPEYCSQEFIELLTIQYEANNKKFNQGLMKYIARKLDREASEKYQIITPTDVQIQQIKRAQEILSKIPSFSNILSYDIFVVKTLGSSVLATADRARNCIVLSQKIFTQGTKYLVSTLIEEFMHLDTGFPDQSRELQTHLFDTITTLIEEHIIKQPI